MKVLLSIIIAIVFLTVPASGTLQLVNRETFQGVGALNSTTPGNLGTVSGTFFKRPIGPKLTGDTTAGGKGWSGDAHGTNPYHFWNVAGGLGTGYSRMICGWYYLGNVSSNGVNGNFMRLLWAGDSLNRNLCSIEISNVSTEGSTPVAGIFLGNDFTPHSATVPITPGWYFFAIAAVYTPATFDTVTWKAYYMPQGGTALIQLGADLSTGGQNTGGAFYGGFYSNTGNLTMQGRYGGASEYTISSFSDVAVPSDLVAPPVGGTNWYVNPATGNDSYDGLSPTVDGNGHGPWQTDAKINTESQYAGMFPVSTGYGTGDTLNIDCSAAPLVIGANGLTINTAGLVVKQHGTSGASDPRTGNLGCDPMKTIAGTWSLVSGSAHTYQNTDGASTDLTSVVIFEDDHDGQGLKYLNHVTGSALSGAVQTALDATPGSFWTDGTTLYLHPFANTNPAGDGKTYRRTRSRPGFAAAITVNAPSVWWDGLVIAGTLLADNATSDPLGAYCFQWNTGFGVNAGNNLLSNFSVDKYSKHGVGRTSGGSNSTMTRQNGIYGQSSPYNAGGCSADVDFSGDTSSANNQGIYINCTETANIGLVGSSTGTINHAISTYVSHASSVAFSNVSFTNCTWLGGLSEEGDVAQMTLSRTTCAQCAVSLNLTCNASLATTYGSLYTNGRNSQLILRNCIFAPTQVPAGAAWNPLPSTAVIEGCTFDLTSAPGGGPKAVVGRTYSGTNLTMRNCLVLGSAGDTRALLGGFSSTDAISMDHNAFVTSVDKVSLAYTSGTTADRSLAQWQTLGFDAGSFNTSQPLLTSYVPQAGSPLINAGANLNPPDNTDYAGGIYAIRQTIGANEPPFLVIATQPMAQVVLVGQSATFSVQTSVTAGVTYQWKKNGADIPGATSATYTIPSVSASDLGNYSVVATGTSTVTSNAAGLLPLTSQSAASQTVALNQAASLTVTPAGTGPFTYQWYKNGTILSGATSATYAIAHVSPGDYAQYTVAVTSNGVTTTAGPYTLLSNLPSSPPSDSPALPPWALVLLAILLVVVAAPKSRSLGRS